MANAILYWVATTSQTWNTNNTGNKWSTSPTSFVAPLTPFYPEANTDVVIPGGGFNGNCVLAAGTRPCRSLKIDNSYTGTLNWTNATGAALTIGDGSAGAGNVALSIGTGTTVTLSSAASLSFISTSTASHTIKTNSRTVPSTTINGASSNYTLQDALGITGSLNVLQGTFNTGGFNVNISGAFNSTGTLNRTINLNSSTVQIGLGSSWNITGSNATLNSGTSTISFPGPLPTASFVGAGFVYNIVSFGSTGGFGANTISIVGSNTIGTLTFASAVNSGVTVSFQAGSTTTITNAINFNGISTDTILVVSHIPGTRYTISKNGALVQANWIELTDCIGTGEAKYFASNSVNNGNNVNWRFNTPNYGTQSLLGCGI